LLPRLVGVTRAADLLLSSRVVLAEEAERLGLVNRVLPPDELLPFTYAYAGRLATEIAPSSLAATKLQLYRDLHGDVASSVRDAGARMADMMAGADFAEGVAALTREAPAAFPDPLAVSRNGSGVHAGGKLGRVPAEQRHRLAEGEAIGHAGHVGDGGPHGTLAAGDHVGVPGARIPVVGDQMRAIGEVLDQGAQHADHGVALPERGVPQVDALVVTGPEGGERLGLLLFHPDLAGAVGGDTTPLMKAPSWALRRSPHSATDGQRQLMGGHDAGQDGILPVVADVGDPVGPAHHLALGGRRRRARPAVVGDPVGGLGTQVERSEGDRRAPRRVVEPPGT
jgi:hypothetical protein